MRHGILAGTPQTRCKALALGTTRAGMPCILLSNTRGFECTTNLLSYGYTDHKGRYCMTALHRACQQSDATLVQLLLENDLNVDEQDVFQRCPLALSAWRNNALGVQHLRDSRADRETRDIFGASPLLRAIQYAAVDTARLLLENKYDVLAVDHESQTLLHRGRIIKRYTYYRTFQREEELYATECRDQCKERLRQNRQRAASDSRTISRAPPSFHEHAGSSRERQNVRAHRTPSRLESRYGPRHLQRRH